MLIVKRIKSLLVSILVLTPLIMTHINAIEIPLEDLTKPEYKDWAPTKPELQLVTRMYADLEGTRLNLGKTSDAGVRRIVPITGGKLVGPMIKGEILNLGADWQIAKEDNTVVLIEARYVLKTDAGALINVTTKGIKVTPLEVLEASKKGPVHPSKYFFKQYVTLETSDPKYAWVNHSLFIGSIMSSGVYKKGIVQDIYLVK